MQRYWVDMFFTQSSNASVWTVNHNLDQKYLNVEVIDDSGKHFEWY